MVATEHEATTRRRNPLRVVIKVLLYIIVKPTILIIMGIRRFPLPALILAMVLAGSVMALNSGTVALPWAPAGAAQTAATTGRLAPETYLTGQKDFNAALMWEAMSDDMRSDLRQRGQTLEAMQQAMEEMKRRGLQYTEFKYVAGTPLNDGRSVHLYIVSASNGQQTQQVAYTFTLNKAGKIEKID